MALRLSLTPLARAPRLRVNAPPELDAVAAAAVEEARVRIAAAPYLFDGSSLMCLNASATEIALYPATYAFYEATRLLGDKSTLGVGGVGVGLLLRDGAGRTLWAKRSEYVQQPLSWCLAASGGLTPAHKSLRDCIVQEAKEELGLPKQALSGLKAHALAVGSYPVGVFVLFEATLAAGYEPKPDGHEVTDLAWVSAPERELDLIEAPLRLLWWELAERGLVGPAVSERRSRRPENPAFGLHLPALAN
jgi:8-oxo-dGTP pyrophosphatase MutT (NUDIX family)